MGGGSEKACFNIKCGATTSPRWRNGWLLRSSGRPVVLCDDCGSKYDQMKFCETFHSEDEGWRTCNLCNKRIHCGCIASAYSFTLVDTGGIECINCASKSNANSVENHIQHPLLFPSQKLLDLPVNNLTETLGSRPSQNSDPKQWLQAPNLWQTLTGQSAVSPWRRIPEVDRPNIDKSMQNNTREQSSASGLSKMDEEIPEKIKNKDLKLGIIESSYRNNAILEAAKDVTVRGSSRMDFLSGDFAKVEGNADDMQDREPASAENIKPGLTGASDILKVSTVDNQLESPASACLNISLGSLVSKDDPSAAVLGLGISSGSPDEAKESTKISATHPQRQRQRQLLPKALQASPSTGSESSKDMHPQVRVARPPGEGRGRNQLLPRYWPRITDQELQQISGDSNSVITPLFEKMLSASDAGRIGRLVLPKACAEAYFPPISQPEGLPLKIQDVKGKEWVFQFRFWPNNNSRMYVLEGVTPCIQSMQLQAGDTVTFSRLDPEGKLVMGFRKASNSASPQEGQPSTTGHGTSPGGGLTTGSIENLSSLEPFSVLPIRSINGNGEASMNAFAGQVNAPDVGFSWYKPDTALNKIKESSTSHPLLLSDKKRSYTLGSKSKRLRIDNEDSLELKLTWEEAQDLLRPPPRAAPTIVMIEGHEFEEYEEAPVFGKHTIFTTNQSGEKHQWAQCDECSSWRRLPVEAFLPPRWTCADNTWDPRRAFCSAPQEVSSEELEKLFQFTTGSRKPENAEGQKVLEASSGLDTLANVAALGENDTAPPLAAATTKHPRHRPGCTCIVCIQPPSGKGPKHKPTCTCNVCMTVKRRFKTLMMRRKKRQSEREAENAKKKRTWVKEEVEVNSGSNWQSDMRSHPENGLKQEKSATVFREALTRVSNFPGDGVNSSSDLILPGSHKGSGVSIEKSMPGKGQIDLNSHPEREDEPLHGVGRMSMMRLLQDASLPLEMYLKQQGLASLVNPQRASMPAVGFEINASEQRVDEQSCTPPNVQNQEEIQEEQLLTPNRVKSDGTSVSI